ncbi:MAG: penicillin-binding protein 2 [Candidatus Marinimicrobia bacterium]|nr:penicillin-binding protein 2 [Candidatus Neomarinimicrobiota bacterium]MCF7827684.1 penicillin-binding protein 2 [Candidatus Neomarinimicrobiota bacterium]MCF7881261.1 penicillin-binding protein 2 [Candidatus Neomarinimicrobiota bacterium]
MISKDNIVSQGRLVTVLGMVIVTFLVLMIRFYDLQIYQHQKFASRAEANRIREVAHPGPRGLIMDRLGNLLVDNRFTYMLSAIPWEVRRSPEVIPELAQYVDMSRDELRLQLQEGYRGAFIPVRLTSGLTFPTISRLEEHRLDLPGIFLSNDPIRFYPSEASLAHVLGYLREVDEREMNRIRRSGKYQLGDLMGWSGIERQYEQVLRGKKGYEYVQVNASGQEIGPVPDKEPVLPHPGSNLYLSLDVELQTYAESMFDTLRGAAVMMNPENGEILSFVSSPSYNLSVFSGAINASDWHTLQADTTRPLFNRGAVGTYPPGSTFKLVTAIAALEEDIVPTDWTVNCPGYYRLGRRVFKCWREGGHGRVDMYDAIEQSCNVYFYQLIRKVGIDNWAKYAGIFQFGERTGVDLPEESAGLLPDRQWMDNRYGERGWSEGHLLNMTVGQGNVLTTPLQMAKFAGILATAGKVVTPHIGVAYETEGGYLEKFEYPTSRITALDSSTYKTVLEGMYRVINGDHGTGRWARIPSALVFGKTGTAQNPHGESHAWFIGILKYKGDIQAIAVLIENGGSGGSIAAPIAGKIMRKSIELRESRNNTAIPTMLSEKLGNE